MTAFSVVPDHFCLRNSFQIYLMTCYYSEQIMLAQ